MFTDTHAYFFMKKVCDKFLWVENSGGSEFLNCIADLANLERLNISVNNQLADDSNKMSSLIFSEKDS